MADKDQDPESPLKKLADLQASREAGVWDLGVGVLGGVVKVWTPQKVGGAPRVTIPPSGAWSPPKLFEEGVEPGAWSPPRLFEKEGVEHLPIQFVFQQVIVMGSIDQSTNYGPRMQGDIINSTLTNTLTAINNFAQSGEKPELASELQKLASHAEELIKKLPTDTAKANAASDLQALTQEATSAAPRKKWYELSGEGLIDAAKTVASMAGPVTETVKKILALLGGGPT